MSYASFVKTIKEVTGQDITIAREVTDDER